MFRRCIFMLSLLLTLSSAASVLGQSDYDQLTEGQTLHGFTTLAVYENGAGDAMGARFLSDDYGFVLDVMQIQSVPQAFYWVKSPPATDRGEPHTCEHLLLGKGNKGRYVAGMEDMMLATSTAYTAQTHTCYHFNTKGGEDAFFQLFEAKLDALCNPNFDDEEISREVCHVGVVEDPETGELSLEEKGTVYTEMVSTYEKHWYHLWGRMDEMLYGEDHPLANISGGRPDAIRTMVPQDLWDFQQSAYRLGNMGAIVSLPDNVKLDDCLGQMKDILKRVQKDKQAPQGIGIGAYTVPPATPAVGPATIEIHGYPSDNTQDPGHILFGYPATLSLDNSEQFLLNLFLEAFAGGSNSNLYNIFINSKTRTMDIGGNSVFAYFSEDKGNPIYVGLSGVTNEYVTEAMIDSVRNVITRELVRVYSFEDNSEELAEFNKRVAARLVSAQKQAEQYLNSPPMFGFRRGSAGGWMSLLRRLEGEPGFRKSLLGKRHFDATEALLAGGTNFWKAHMDTWRLLASTPMAVGVGPAPDMLEHEAQEKAERIAAYTSAYEKEYKTDDARSAIEAYKSDFDKETERLEDMAANQSMPSFMDSPPMTLDDQLKYEVVTLPSDIPMVASTFDNMTSATVGLALRLDPIPENRLLYVPALASVLTEIGVVKDGTAIPFEEMSDRVRNEILGLRAYIDHNPQTERVELVLRGQGANRGELFTALDWMEAALFSPYLDEANLPRMRDLVDQGLTSLRNRMKGSEEAWVNDPAEGWQYQSNPLVLTASNFLTQAHDLHRLKFRLMDPGTDVDRDLVGAVLDAAQALETTGGGDALAGKLAALDDSTVEMTADVQALAEAVTAAEATEQAAENTREIIEALKLTLPEIPNECLVGDWRYLCQQIQADLMMTPAVTLAEIDDVLTSIRRADNARLFMISNSEDRAAGMKPLTDLVGKLDSSEKTIRQTYAMAPRILERLQEHQKVEGMPTYVGLVNENTRNGVLIFSAPNAGQYDASENAVLDCLTGKLYSGGGAHGLFMKTWGAGLAYSNGYSYGQRSGNVRYYAERCPDVSETMRFVVNTLKESSDDAHLTEYAVALVFGTSRAAGRYESRGEAMASDLADGIHPDRVVNFNRRVLEMRTKENLNSILRERMESVYGKVMIGYGPKLGSIPGSSHFLIGPEPQFESLEQLIATAEGPQKVYRLYPRDFWLTL
jgi:Zn-dependent M16 (insulinase) family peptidase